MPVAHEESTGIASGTQAGSDRAGLERLFYFYLAAHADSAARCS